MFYSSSGQELHKKFNKKVVSETEWYYEAWFQADEAYYLIENVPEGYTVRYENVGAYADVTDRCYNGGTIINMKVPKTGDDGHPVLYAALSALAILGMAACVIGARKMKKGRK